MRKQLFKLRLLRVLAVLIAAAATAMTANAQQVTANVTCDNYWALYYGTPNSITYSNQSGAYPSAAPFTFTVPPGNNYIYFVVWDDQSVGHGFLASLQGQYGPLVLSGGAWQVKPTNLISSGLGPLSGLPSNAFLTSTAFVNSLTSLIGSSGWTSPFVGPLNSLPAGSNMMGATKPWPPIASINPAARWIWYKRPPATLACSGSPGSPLASPCDHGEPLIFRLPVEALSCLAVKQIKPPQCRGRDAHGNPIYAFSATVTNPSSATIPLTISAPTGTVNLSYAPHSLHPGVSVVNGTFTVVGQPPHPLCLVFEVTLPDYSEDSGGGSETGKESNRPANAPGTGKLSPIVKCKGTLCFMDLPTC